MDLRESLKMTRSELGVTQMQFADMLNVSFAAVNRWENGKSRPCRATSLALLNTAKAHKLSAKCLDSLTRALKDNRADDSEEIAIAEKMKIEQRELLTSWQLKAVLDNINIAVYAMRAYTNRKLGGEVFYYNRHLLEMFDYTEEEYFDEHANSVYARVHEKDLPDYLEKLEFLFNGMIEPGDFSCDIRVHRKDGSIIWLNVKGISMYEYSFGKEYFFSCSNITKRVEAEQKYQEEMAYRAAFVKNSVAHAHCNLTQNTVMSIDIKMPRKFSSAHYETVDEFFNSFVDNCAVEECKGCFSTLFNRDKMLAAFASGDIQNSCVHFDERLHHWLKTEYYLLLNPISNCVEAIINTIDIHDEKLTRLVLDIIARKAFDYIGCFDLETGSYEYCFKNSKQIRFPEEKKGDYAQYYVEQLRRSVVPEDLDEAIEKMKLSYVCEQLDKNEFYSHTLRIAEKDGNMRTKMLTYTYLDESHREIAVARSDIDNVLFLAPNRHALIIGNNIKQSE